MEEFLLERSAICTFLGKLFISRCLKECPVALATSFLSLEVPMSYIIFLMFLRQDPTTIMIHRVSLISFSVVDITLKQSHPLSS